MKTFYIACFVLVTLVHVLSSKSINIDVDGALFRGDSTGYIWEMYYSVPDTSFSYIYRDGMFTGSMDFSVTMTEESGTVIKDIWTVQYSSAEKITALNQILLGIRRIAVKPVNYKVKLEIRDKNDSQTYAIQNFDVDFRSNPLIKAALSDIMLSKKIVPANESTDGTVDINFLKGDYYLFPNPMLEYNGTDPIVIIYNEVYNDSMYDSIFLTIEYKIYDSHKHPVFGDQKLRTIYGKRFDLISTIPISKFHSGVYTLEIKSKYNDGDSIESVSRFKKFYIINPAMPPKESNYFSENIVFEKSEFITMGAEKIEEEIDQAMLIATIFEAQRFDELSTQEAKQRALFNFWITRDPDTTTSYNEKRMEFKSLIEYANSYFSYGMNTSGWKTDRGRILLTYGQPDQRDVHPAQDNYRAYETWIYNLQNQLTFNFVDLQGFGSFILVHSNALGYVKNENWFDMYVKEVNLNNDADSYYNSLINGTRNR